MSSETPVELVEAKLHTVTLKFDAGTPHRARAIYHAIRVEKEPNNSIKRICDTSDKFVNVKLESAELSSLRASSNGLLDILKILSEVIQKFDLKSSSADYDHF